MCWARAFTLLSESTQSVEPGGMRASSARSKEPIIGVHPTSSTTLLEGGQADGMGAVRGWYGRGTRMVRGE